MQGHFGAALLVSVLTSQTTPLAHLFLAAQVQDLLITLFAYTLHIEKAHLAPNSDNKVFPIALDYVPYSHGLFATLVLCLLCCVLPIAPISKVALSLAVLSHWILDWIVHLPDLDLCFPFTDCGKAGLGLWRYLVPSLVVECAIVMAGALLYVRSVPGREASQRVMWRLLPLTAFMVAVTVAMPFLPPPKRLDSSITVQTHVLYGIFALVGWAIERPVKLARAMKKHE